jgi:hypothetical protein
MLANSIACILGVIVAAVVNVRHVMSQTPVSKFAFLCAHKRPDHIPIPSRNRPWITVKAIENPRLDIIIKVVSSNHRTR